MALKDIKHIIIVMMENRSFDHMMGYLSLPIANPPMRVDGLHYDDHWQTLYANDNRAGTPIKVRPLDPSVQSIPDPPHDLASINMQITTATHAGAVPDLGGFVQSYERARPKDARIAMGYYTKASVPVFDFFARTFRICDHWFSSLPTSTQPNRLMAMSGESKIDDNVTIFNFPDQDLVYDWLTSHNISWCVYHWEGNHPFFTLMSRWRGRILDQLHKKWAINFRHYKTTFHQEWKNGKDQSGGDIPSVIFIEPQYADDFNPADPNDDHPPIGIAKGQTFLRDIYNTLITNQGLWRNTMMIVAYDEHGGFFDHEAPLNIPTLAGRTQFQTTGLRVPAFIVSPQVLPGVPFTGHLDHTSILQLLADRFASGQDYSKAVADRQKHLVRLSTALVEHPTPLFAQTPKKAPPSPKIPRMPTRIAKPVEPLTVNQEAFREVALAEATRFPELVDKPIRAKTVPPGKRNKQGAKAKSPRK